MDRTLVNSLMDEASSDDGRAYAALASAVQAEFTTKFREVRDIRRLDRLHHVLADRFRERGQPVSQSDTKYEGDALRYVAHAILEDSFRDQVGTGYLAEDPSGFRPTLKGAWVMAWKELWPVKSVRRWREKRRAESLLAEVEP